MNLIGLIIILCFSHHFHFVFYFRTYHSPELWVTKSFREYRVTFLVSPLSLSVKYHTFLSSTQLPNGGHRAQWLRGFSSNCMKSGQLQLSQWKDIFLLLQILKRYYFFLEFSCKFQLLDIAHAILPALGYREKCNAQYGSRVILDILIYKMRIEVPNLPSDMFL